MESHEASDHLVYKDLNSSIYNIKGCVLLFRPEPTFFILEENYESKWCCHSDVNNVGVPILSGVTGGEGEEYSDTQLALSKFKDFT